MSSAERPSTADEFREVLAALSDDRARLLLESDRCPTPRPTRSHEWEEYTEALSLEEADDDLVIYRTDAAEAWIQSDLYGSLADAA